MRIESSVTSVSWIPSEAVTGMTRAVRGGRHALRQPAARRDRRPRGLGAADAVPLREPARGVDRSRGRRDRRRRLRRRRGDGLDDRAPRRSEATFAGGRAPASSSDDPEVSDDRRPRSCRPTAAARRSRRRGASATHRSCSSSAPTGVDHAARSRSAPTARATFELAGASAFPRHWVYDDDGKLAAKAGLADFKEWYRHSFGKHTPWGDEDSKALVTTVETALERELSDVDHAGGGKPKIRKLRRRARRSSSRASRATRYSSCSTVCCRWTSTASRSPSSARARSSASAPFSRAACARRRFAPSTKCRVAAVPADNLDLDAPSEISKTHRREET